MLRYIIFAMSVLPVFGASGSDPGYKLSDLPSARNGDLILAAFVGREVLAPIAEEVTQTKGTPPAIYIVNAYLMNRGPKPITVLLGTADQIGTAKNGSLLLISYSPSYWDGFGDVSIKPRLEDYRPITLKPGEVAALPVKKIELGEVPKRLRVGYGVSQQFAKHYEVWTGNIAVEVSVPK
jgi:hypothetical protein